MTAGAPAGAGAESRIRGAGAEKITRPARVAAVRNLWHCLGACQAGGSVIGWVMLAEGVSFRHAVELLRDGMPGVSSGPAPKRSTVRKLASSMDRAAADDELLGRSWITTTGAEGVAGRAGLPVAPED